MKKLLLALSLTAAAALALAVAPRTGAADSALLDFDNFVCPGPCSIGAPVCCMIMDPICVPEPCPPEQPG